MRLNITRSRRGSALAAALAAASLLTAAGCSTVASASVASSTQHQYVVRDASNGKTIWLHTGDRIELILSSNYWQVSGSSAPKVLRQTHATVLMPRPSTCPRIPGLGCIPVRTDFLAVGHGKAVITATRTSCGEAMRCSSQNSHFTLIVRIH
ncbi:MAG TPA: hypothetical protein VKU39_16315 [Streptosporangiaceae bacterium]|nr:hypothetical protein [Streptosporangiaceae bacterium]